MGSYPDLYNAVTAPKDSFPAQHVRRHITSLTQVAEWSQPHFDPSL